MKSQPEGRGIFIQAEIVRIGSDKMRISNDGIGIVPGGFPFRECSIPEFYARAIVRCPRIEIKIRVHDKPVIPPIAAEQIT
jgi:hypothetical protein